MKLGCLDLSIYIRVYSKINYMIFLLKISSYEIKIKF